MDEFNKKIGYMELHDFDPKTKRFLVGKKLVIMCMAGWCGACKMTKPEYVAIADRLRKKGIIAACLPYDGDEEEKELGKRISQAFQVQAFPTFLKVDEKGNVVDKVVGGMKADDLYNKLAF